GTLPRPPSRRPPPASPKPHGAAPARQARRRPPVLRGSLGSLVRRPLPVAQGGQGEEPAPVLHDRLPLVEGGRLRRRGPARPARPRPEDERNRGQLPLLVRE